MFKKDTYKQLKKAFKKAGFKKEVSGHKYSIDGQYIFYVKEGCDFAIKETYSKLKLKIAKYDTTLRDLTLPTVADVSSDASGEIYQKELLQQILKDNDIKFNLEDLNAEVYG